MCLMTGSVCHSAARRTMNGVTYLIDATAVKLNARSTDWAQFSATTCGAKLHIIYDPAADRPVYWAVTAGNVNDITAAKAMPIVHGATYVYDLAFYESRSRSRRPSNTTSRRPSSSSSASHIRRPRFRVLLFVMAGIVPRLSGTCFA